MRLRQKVLIVSTSWWNRLVDRWFAGRLVQVQVIQPPYWRYPFTCDLRWDTTAETWSVGIVLRTLTEAIDHAIELKTCQPR